LVCARLAELMFAAVTTSESAAAADQGMKKAGTAADLGMKLRNVDAVAAGARWSSHGAGCLARISLQAVPKESDIACCQGRKPVVMRVLLYL
jgi:hypothetical protein